METKTLLRLIKDDISHLQGITDDFDIQSLPSYDEVELALVKAKALVRQLELLHKRIESNSNELSALNTTDTIKDGIFVPIQSGPEQMGTAEQSDDIKSVILREVIEKPAPPREPVTPFLYETEPILREPVADSSVQKEVLPTVGSEEIIKTEENTLGESNQMVNEILSQEKSESGYQIIPINNIWDGIGINDRILFIRELFGNNSSKFETAITTLNQLNTIQEAVSYLKLNFIWRKTEASQKFLALVKRRFTN
jgi:hypothetical protein